MSKLGTNDVNWLLLNRRLEQINQYVSIIYSAENNLKGRELVSLHEHWYI